LVSVDTFVGRDALETEATAITAAVSILPASISTTLNESGKKKTNVAYRLLQAQTQPEFQESA